MSLNKQEHLAREIGKMRDSVRKKLRDLKQSSVQSQREFETQYKPIIEPLTNMSNNVASKLASPTLAMDVKDEQEEEVEDEVEIQPQTVLKHDSESDDDMSYRKYSDSELSVGDELETYLKFTQTQNKNDIDLAYGIRFDNNTWKMGQLPVSFIDNDIVINGIRYKGTPGLFELVFKKVPAKVYDEKDLNTYKQMLMHTEVHKHVGGKRIKSNRGYKYLNIISKLISPRKRKQIKTFAYDKVRRMSSVTPTESLQKTELIDALKIKKRQTTSKPLTPPHKEKKSKIGEGLLMRVNSSKIDYRYWDDPNELVDRLRLLLASKEAGNTGHTNEIIAILEELKEARIIKDYDYFEL